MSATRRVHGQKYDLVHAHDWMTFPAGIEIARRAGAPLLVLVHSLEYDRAGHGADRDIVAVEHQGLENAARVIAVSYYTRGLINRVHNTPLDKISVVHNGVYARETVEAYTEQRTSTGPVVLFLGRVTFQKGPEYFVQAAARVLEQVPDAVFIMAGSGDMLPRMKALVEDLGIAESFRFPGFLRGPGGRARFLDGGRLRHAVGLGAFRHRSAGGDELRPACHRVEAIRRLGSASQCTQGRLLGRRQDRKPDRGALGAP